jgi:cytochrome c2
MTNAQKWVAGFLILFVFLFVLLKITEDEETVSSTEQYNQEQQQQQQEEESKFTGDEKQDGLTLIQNNGCTSCHGQDLKGTNLAPGLYNVSQHWDRKGLINYLRNPDEYSGDDRFEKLSEEYSTIMPGYDNLEVKELGKMSDYLLSLDQKND